MSTAPQLFYRVRLARSFIGMPATTRKTCEALGLTKRGKIVYQPVNTANSGQLLKIKELVKIQVVDRSLTREQERLLRRQPAGFEVEKNLLK